jgi:pimeloyl-ACP methyl ester carboxylesterase
MATSRGKTIGVEGSDLYFEERGSGPPLLLLHGLTGTSANWEHVFNLDALAADFHIVAPDARGHGRSTNPGGAFTFRRCALDVLALLDHLSLERVHAVGASLGAKTLLHVATLAPSRIERMILVSATPRFPAATRATFRAASAAPHSPQEWESMRAQHVNGDQQIEALFNLPAVFAADETDMAFTADRLAAITATTLIVAGDRDPLYPVELAVELLRGIRRASLWVVPNGGHGPIYGHERAEFERRALSFLRAP